MLIVARSKDRCKLPLAILLAVGVLGLSLVPDRVEAWPIVVWLTQVFRFYGLIITEIGSPTQPVAAVDVDAAGAVG